MAVAYVQSTSYNSGSGISATGTLVFTTTPTVGNLLVVGLGYAGPKHPSAAPSGWTLLDDLEAGTSAWLTTYYHVVGSSEANSYTFTTTGGDYYGIVGYEISGQATTGFINQHAIIAGSASPTNTPAVTPSVIGTLPLAFIAYNDGTAANATAATVGTGFTLDQNPQPQYHSMAGAHGNAVTTDITTAISAAFSWFVDTNVSSTILIAPTSGGGGTVVSISTALLMGV